MIGALLRKDWRLNRVVIITGAIVSVLPYALTLVDRRFNPPPYRVVELRDYLDGAQFAAVACLGLVVVFAAVFGGVAFAAERRERTAEFLAMLPAPRPIIVVSKLLVALACLIVLIVIHVLVIFATNWWASVAGMRAIRGPTPAEAAGMAATFAVALFGTAWALSVFLRSPAIAASIAIAVGFGLLFGGTAWATKAFRALDLAYMTRTPEGTVIAVVCAASAVVGSIAIVASSVHYVRRVEP